MELVFTSEVGDNSDLIAHVAAMYLKPGDKVADVTYGKGVFWRKIISGMYNTSFSDLITGPEHFDFRKLPYGDASFDCVILDPPYTHNPGRLIVEANYKNRETTKGMYHADIMQLYFGGMTEAWRILKEGGYLWVKCKDEVESSYQCWSHIEIYDEALRMGFFGKDLFIMTQKTHPVVQHHNQQHARKNHSYLWVFKKPLVQEIRDLKRLRSTQFDTQRCRHRGAPLAAKEEK